MLPGSFSPSFPPSLDVVDVNSAVCYQEVAANEPRWVVLEDTNKPNGDFDEISSGSHLAQALMGKRVGDIAVVAKGHFQDRTAKILYILPKYVRRYQDTMAEMQVRFGAASSVESVRFGGPDDMDLKKGVQTILDSVKRRADALRGLRQLYASKPMPLHLYGAEFDGNAYLSLADLALESGHEVKCNFGTAEEREQGLRALRTAQAVVVDITALATLRLLGLTKILSSQRHKFVVSQAARRTLHEMFVNNKVFSGEGRTIAFEHGRHIMREHTDESRAQDRREDEEFIAFVERVTESRSGEQLAALEASRREVLENLFGQYGAEAIVLASAPNHVLWTDDLVQAQIAATEYGVSRIWTQLLLGTLADEGLVSSEEYSAATARLIGMEFIATLFDASSLLAGFRLAAWSSHSAPAAQFAKIFADPSANLQALLTILVEFVQKLFREPISPSERCTVIRSLLDGMGRRPEGAMLLTSLRRSTPRIFGINVLGQVQFEHCYDEWLKGRDNPLVLAG